MADKATWLGPTEAELAQQIQARFDLETGPASRHAARAAGLSLRLRPAYEAFWNHGVLEAGLAIQAWSLGGLMKDFGMSPLAAFSALDWLIRDPVEAGKALRAGVHGRRP